VHFGGARVPQIGERIRVYGYRFGGGLAGNVPAGALTATVGGAKITNPLPAAGGADAASLTEALDAIPADVHRRDRAVVADDFRDLALQVTGVGRAEALPLLHPDTPAVNAAGVVSVVVFPTEDLTAPQAPLPGLGLLTRVARYLNARRLVTTELYVIPPTYRQVAVSIGLSIRSGYQVDAVRQWVDRILRQYLGVLPPSGPDGTGWPLERTVRIAELEAVAVQVEGVEYIVGSELGVPDGSGVFSHESIVEMKRWEVPELVALTVVSGPPRPVGVPQAPVDPGTMVPLPPDVC
jgi:predicted phage baseplate assembly protein